MDEIYSHIQTRDTQNLAIQVSSWGCKKFATQEPWTTRGGWQIGRCLDFFSPWSRWNCRDPRLQICFLVIIEESEPAKGNFNFFFPVVKRFWKSGVTSCLRRSKKTTTTTTTTHAERKKEKMKERTATCWRYVHYSQSCLSLVIVLHRSMQPLSTTPKKIRNRQ